MREQVERTILPRVQTPAQYIGGELNAVVKSPEGLRGRMCLAFPDAYTIGMSCHGLQVLYAAVNRRPDWACERIFTPGRDMEAILRQEGIPLWSLETFSPLWQFDIVGFSLQYELLATNILTILDLGGIPLRSQERTDRDPLVIAGGPCVQNPEPWVPFIDLFILGDGEESLLEVADAWLEVRSQGGTRQEKLARLAARFACVYVPSLYQAALDADGRPLPPVPFRPEARPVIEPAVLLDLESFPLPTRPVVPHVAAVQDRITLEIMRGCPWRCRFCQSNPMKRPVRFRKVETILRAAWESYWATGYNEIGLLSLSTSDYPYFDELMDRLSAEFGPLGVSISVPSLRINHQWRLLALQLGTERHSGLTLAPEAARDEMRRRIGKQVTNDDLLEGCRQAFQRGFHRVKLYFMCGLPGETAQDLTAIVDLAEDIARVGRQVRGRPVTVVANVSNFIPKPHTPFQWLGMASREYLQQAHRLLRRRVRLRSVEIKCHDPDASLLEGLISRGDRRLGDVIQWAWEHGARFDAWTDQFQPQLWQEALRACRLDPAPLLHQPYQLDRPLPWDHTTVRQGRQYLQQEYLQSIDVNLQP
ncbi:MAG: TIGR03960 family B12-binding radical SAM protein [Thermoguttaceae bacterium]|nr:TIGR03960 family B12-binding radical SAM protein [Thermoguttaceae bacterium]MDW8038489.1 TIGR03960 family B12-binding radical SAM protein [Thermoguttaceae bacterium]